jgi:hypothetical protein
VGRGVEGGRRERMTRRRDDSAGHWTKLWLVQRGSKTVYTGHLLTCTNCSLIACSPRTMPCSCWIQRIFQVRDTPRMVTQTEDRSQKSWYDYWIDHCRTLLTKHLHP